VEEGGCGAVGGGAVTVGTEKRVQGGCIKCNKDNKD